MYSYVLQLVGDDVDSVAYWVLEDTLRDVERGQVRGRFETRSAHKKVLYRREFSKDRLARQFSGRAPSIRGNVSRRPMLCKKAGPLPAFGVSFEKTMFEDTNLFIGLDDADPSARLETVEKLRASVRQGGGELPVHNLTQLFQLMSDRLKDDDNRVALMSAELLCDLLSRDLLTTDIYFPIVLPAMFLNLANSARRESSVYVLTTYVEAMGGAECILEGLVQHGLMHDDPRVREQTLRTLPTIVEGYLVPSASAGRDDYMKLLDELVQRLRDDNVRVAKAAGSALRFARSEDKNFTKHVESFGKAAVEIVDKVLSAPPDDPQSPGSPLWDAPGVASAGEGSSGAGGSIGQSSDGAGGAGGNTAAADNFGNGIERKHSDDNETKDAAADATELERQKSRVSDMLRNHSAKRGGTEFGSPSSDANASARSSPQGAVSPGRGIENELEAASTTIPTTEAKSLTDQKSDASSFTAESTSSPLPSPSAAATPAEHHGSSSGGAEARAETKNADIIEIPGNRMAELAAAGKRKEASETTSNDAYSEIHGSARTAPVAGGVVRLVYGLISSPTMSQLQDQGSWKARASAIENVLATVTDMSEADVHLVRPHIPELFKFLATMLNDANFKISITTLHILEALVQKLGPHMRGPHANLLVKDLVDQLGANKAVVRQAALQVFTSLLQVS